MKHATKFIAALAVMASFSALAAEAIDTSAGVEDMAAAIELAGDGTTSAAVIIQTAGDSFAAIQQTGTNAAVIVQSTDGSRAAIVQTGSGNTGIIMQGE
jgi:hypothetical protein